MSRGRDAKWNTAQDRELEWWASRDETLSTPQRVDLKRRATLDIWDHVVRVMGSDPPRRVLEIGTGGDGFVNFIPNAFCVGLEPLLMRMKGAGIGLFAPEARFVLGVGERLPFRNDCFDVAFLYNVLDHVAQPGAILDETRRVLRHDGLLHVLLDTYSWSFSVYRALRPDPMHPHTFTPGRFREEMESRGFRVVDDLSDAQPKDLRRHLQVRAFYRVGK